MLIGPLYAAGFADAPGRSAQFSIAEATPAASFLRVVENMQTAVRNIPSSSDLHELRGSRPLFAEELRTRIEAGARCVRFEYCFSLLVVTVRRQSPIYLTNSWQERYLRGLWFSFLALVLGPWGVPWGIVWTGWSVWVNTTGGVDCTSEVLAEACSSE